MHDSQFTTPAQRQSELPSVSPARQASPPETNTPIGVRRLRIYSHSPILYWWPVWLVGYSMALITYWYGQEHDIGQTRTWIHPSSNPGLLFIFVLFLVIVITNFSVRGMSSAVVVLGAAFVTVLLAYIGWWDHVFSWIGGLEISLNLGAYFWFSTLMLVLWTVCVFAIDRISYWEVKPGQLTRHTMFGAGSRSYSAQGMGLEKHRADLFRHWLLGLGSGDLEIHTSGASRVQIDIRNVMFVGSKVGIIKKLIAEVPEGEESS